MLSWAVDSRSLNPEFTISAIGELYDTENLLKLSYASIGKTNRKNLLYDKIGSISIVLYYSFLCLLL